MIKISLNNSENIFIRSPKFSDLSKIWKFINDLADEDVMIKSSQKYTLDEIIIREN